MDFLDPRKRQAYHARLIIGYILVAIVIGLGTVILVYGANGYGINTKTGQIIQNGLLFVDSKPSGAEIYLNGVDLHTTTSARRILPAGHYDLTLKKNGYQSWSRGFDLNGQSIVRYVYPFLFPVKPALSNLKTYASAPGLITQSPDQKWLLVQKPGNTTTPQFDEYDTTTLNQTTPVIKALNLPSNLLTNYSSSSKLKEIEWSSDNTHLLLEHIYRAGSEFIVLDRSSPNQSFNVNSMFGTSPTLVSLQDKKTSGLYIYNKSKGSLQLGDTSSKKLQTIISKQVLAYKPYTKDLVIYVTSSGEPSGQVAARIWDNGKNYPLYEFRAGTSYLVDVSQYQGQFYYAAGSNTSDRINIYKNPLNDINNPSLGKALPVLALHNLGANKISFSDNNRFIEVEGKQRFAVYDIETQARYQYPLSYKLSANMKWMNGYQLIGESKGNILVMDYDGINIQLVASTNNPAGGFFSPDYNYLLTTVTPIGKNTVTLENIDMRAGSDLPNR